MQIIRALALAFAVVASTATLPAQSLSLLDVQAGTPPVVERPVPPAANLFRLDIYLESQPPAGMTAADFAHADAGGSIRAVLVPDRDDPAPLGSRMPLVLVHGLMLKDAREKGRVHPEKAAIWDPFRASFPASLRRHYKPYFFLYPTSNGPRDAGRELARQVRGTLAEAGCPDRKIAFLGHSMGGLTFRHAMNTDGLGEQVATAASIATPHHGSVLASLFPANVRLKEKLGWFRWIALQGTLSITPYPLAVDDIAYDNVGGEFDPAEARQMGVNLNDTLARFNREDRYLPKVTALMADLRAPRWHFSVFKMLRYVPAYIVGPLSENFRSLDPLVHYESGSCETGACPTMPLAGRKSYEGVDHSSIMEDGRVMSDLYALLGRQADAPRP